MDTIYLVAVQLVLPSILIIAIAFSFKLYEYIKVKLGIKIINEEVYTIDENIKKYFKTTLVWGFIFSLIVFYWFNNTVNKEDIITFDIALYIGYAMAFIGNIMVSILNSSNLKGNKNI